MDMGLVLGTGGTGTGNGKYENGKEQPTQALYDNGYLGATYIF